MNLDPSLAVQKAVFEILTEANAAGKAIFHDVPDDTPLPFIKIGDDQISGQDEAGDWSEVEVEIHILAASIVQAKEIAAVVRNALSHRLELDGFETIEWHFGTSRPVPEPDGETAHLLIQLDYLVQPTG